MEPSSARRITRCSVIITFGRDAGTTRLTTCPMGVGLVTGGFSGVNVFVILTGVSCRTPLPNYINKVLISMKCSILKVYTHSFEGLDRSTSDEPRLSGALLQLHPGFV